MSQRTMSDRPRTALCTQIRFEGDDELPRFRIGDEYGNNDVSVDDQLRSSSLR
jgi:hypothetical protein